MKLPQNLDEAYTQLRMDIERLTNHVVIMDKEGAPDFNTNMILNMARIIQEMLYQQKQYQKYVRENS